MSIAMITVTEEITNEPVWLVVDTSEDPNSPYWLLGRFYQHELACAYLEELKDELLEDWPYPEDMDLTGDPGDWGDEKDAEELEYIRWVDGEDEFIDEMDEVAKNACWATVQAIYPVSFGENITRAKPGDSDYVAPTWLGTDEEIPF